MVISKLDKQEKEIITLIGADNFSDGFREMRDSLLELKQDEGKFLELFKKVDFKGFKESFLEELKTKIADFNQKSNIDIYPSLEFFGKNYKLTKDKNGFEVASIVDLKLSGYSITKKMNSNNTHLFIKNKYEKDVRVEVEIVYFKVKINNLKFDSEFEKGIPQDVLKNLYTFIADYISNMNMYNGLILNIESDDEILLKNVENVNNRIVFDETKSKIRYLVNRITSICLYIKKMMMSVIYDFDDKQFKIVDSDTTKNFKNKMFFGHIGNHERYNAIFINSLFDEEERMKFSSKLYRDFIRLAESKIRKTLTSNKMMSLNEVKNKNIPVNLLSDQQILESLRATHSLLDIALIKDSIPDEKQWARVLNIIDGYLNSIK
jgi:hypothetical protein